MPKSRKLKTSCSRRSVRKCKTAKKSCELKKSSKTSKKYCRTRK